MPPRDQGFSLVEVLVALTLTLFMMAGVCRLACLTTQAAASGDRLTWATHLCNAKLVQLQAAPGLQAGWHADAANPLECGGQMFARYWSVADCAGGQLVEVYVSFAESGRPAALRAGGPVDLAASPHQILRAFIAAP